VGAVLGLKQTQYAGISASQQLFNPQLFIALKAVKTANELTALQLSQTKEDVAYNVSATYYNLLSLYKSMDLLQANIKSFETTIKTTETLQRNDLAKKSDVSRLILAKKALETQLMNLKVTEITLLNVLRLLTNTPTEVPFIIDSNVNTAVGLITVADSTVSNRTDYKLLQTSIALKEIERKSVLASYMPTIVLFGGYFSYAYNPDFNPGQRAEDKSFPVSQIGLSLKLPIFDGGERHAKTRQKSIELEKLNYQKQLVQQQARNEMLNAIEKYNANVAILKKEEENIALAQTTLDETKTNYRNGFSSITDIINAENDLLKTQTDYITALVNVRLAVLEWKKANGTLLNF
jgi:outer membrane protein TolC